MMWQFCCLLITFICFLLVMSLCVFDRARDNNFPLWKCICTILSVCALAIIVGCWWYNMGKQDGIKEYIKGKADVELNYTIDSNGVVKDTIFIFK